MLTYTITLNFWIFYKVLLNKNKTQSKIMVFKINTNTFKSRLEASLKMKFLKAYRQQ